MIAKRVFAACIAAVMVLTVRSLNSTETEMETTSIELTMANEEYCKDFPSGGEVRSGTSATSLLSVPRSAPGEHCKAGIIAWSAPRGERLLAFIREKTSFTVGIRLMLPQSAVSGNFTAHILRGSRKFPVTFSDDEEIRIQSYCSQVSLLVDAGAAEHMMGNDSSVFTMAFEYKVMDINTKVCPRCSESCMLSCMCQSDHILVGTVLQSIKEGHSYRHKVDVQYYLKYNGCQNPRFLRTPVCPGQEPKWWQQSPMSTLTENIRCSGPRFIDVIGKCELVPDKKYIIAGYPWHIHGRSLSMHLCCAETTYKSAWQLYQHNLDTNRCCIHESNE